MLGLLSMHLDHPRRVFGGIYHCANVVGIDAAVLIICKL